MFPSHLIILHHRNPDRNFHVGIGIWSAEHTYIFNGSKRA